MEFAGEWHQFPDGNIRPAIEVQLRGADGNWHREYFLLDSGADRTILSADFLRRLQLPTMPHPSGFSLGGIGGAAVYVLVDVDFRLVETDGTPRDYQSRFAALLNPAASDHSLLGRDVLDAFDVIVSRRRNEVRLLAGVHYYDIRSP